MSHHYCGPNFGFPGGDACLNLTDLYVFPKPDGTAKSILIMNVHPSVAWDQSPTLRDPFAPEVLYELRIDTNGDAIVDVTYRVRFSAVSGGSQTATLSRIEGAQTTGAGAIGQVIIETAPVSFGREAQVTAMSDYRFFAGWRSDPFFFDPIGAVNNPQFTGKDFFLDKDVCGIVLEVPNSALGSPQLGLWARTLNGAGGRWIQADRGARPGQAPFLAGEQIDAYLLAEPADDARFIPAFAHSLEHAGGYTPEQARRVADTLLPDLIPFAPARPASYPENGRALTDDVLDHFLSILTNGKVRSDGVAAHKDLLTEFPYLGPPHRTAPPTLPKER
jgi:hypothetical protein